MLLGIDVSFKKETSGFLITLKKGDIKEFVVLPLSHLSENKIENYIELLCSKM